MTGYDKHIYSEKYLNDQPGMTGEATEWLIDQGVKLMGIDTYTFDRPFGAMVADEKESNKSLYSQRILWAVKRSITIFEKLANLDQYEIKHGFKILCISN